MRGEDSAGRARLNWRLFYEDTLDAPAYQDILKNSLLPAAKEWFGDEKEGWEPQQDKACKPRRCTVLCSFL